MVSAPFGGSVFFRPNICPMRKPAPTLAKAASKKSLTVQRPTKILFGICALLFFGTVLHYRSAPSDLTAYAPPTPAPPLPPWQQDPTIRNKQPIAAVGTVTDGVAAQGNLRGASNEPTVTTAEPAVAAPPQPPAPATRSVQYTSVDDAVANRPGGPTDYDKAWAALREQHAAGYASIVKHPVRCFTGRSVHRICICVYFYYVCAAQSAGCKWHGAVHEGRHGHMGVVPNA